VLTNKSTHSMVYIKVLHETIVLVETTLSVMALMRLGRKKVLTNEILIICTIII
jgi:hypothetical protein